MLALRYLNPLRSLFSIITLICLAGVAMGVMVLIVVLSVMEGLQHEMQDRVLAFTPHYSISATNGLGTRLRISESRSKWTETLEKIQHIPGVVSAYPQLENEAFVQSVEGRKTARFHAIQAENAGQLTPLNEMLREGSFDFGMGLDEQCVISLQTAQSLRLRLGDMLHLTPVGSLDEVAAVYSLIQKPLATHANTAFMKQVAEFFPAPSAEKAQAVMDTILGYQESELREGEKDLMRQLYQILHRRSDGEAFTPEDEADWKKTATTLAALDRDKEDGRAVKSINELVMPVDLEVIGIYQTPENMPGPDIFLPLAIAQDIMGYSIDGDSQIQGIAVRVNDAHQIAELEEALVATLPNTDADGSPSTIQWSILPWTKSLERWFKLIANERTMMSFVLSVISLISAFCIMAVMFTISMQRRREIAVMQALGATPWTIMRIFLWQGVIIGFLGALLGIGLALLVLHYRVEIQMILSALGLDPFPMEAHGISLPAAYNPETFIRQAITAFIMVTIAAVVPAFIVSRQDPARALRSN